MNSTRRIVIPPSANNTPATETGTETRRIEKAHSTPVDQVPDSLLYIRIKQDKYKIIQPLSKGSGEAKIFLVENANGEQFVIKRYFHNFTPKKELLDTIKKMDSSPYITKLHDYGVTYDELGSECTYEIMEYIDGGTLEDMKLSDNFQQFADLALSIAKALKLLHTCHLIHRDIKPANVCIRKGRPHEAVLSDFGISSLFTDRDALHRTTQNRTPAYSAPELYNDVIEDTVGITYKFDYYALGITLLELWLGFSPFKDVDEFVALQLKRNKKIPYINELPERVATLIKGLTINDPAHRWEYSQIDAWYRDEDVPVYVEEYMQRRMHPFDFDNSKDLYAETPEQLATLLKAHPLLGTRYLYENKIGDWLLRNGYKEEFAMIEDIVEKQYPQDQQAGLVAAIYALDDSMPFLDHHDNKCATPRELADSLIKNQALYKVKLRHPNDPLFIFLKYRNLKEIIPQDWTDNEDKAFWSLVYALHPATPYSLYILTQEGKDIQVECETLTELLDSCRDFELSATSKDDLTNLNGRFLQWLGHNPEQIAMAAVITDLLQKNQHIPVKEDLHYAVLYQLDPHRGYYLHSRNYIPATPQDRDYYAGYELGELLNTNLIRRQRCTDPVVFAEQMKEFLAPYHRLYFYCHIHGWHLKTQEMERRMDPSSPLYQNREEPFHYIAAAYAFCSYLLTIDKSYQHPVFYIHQQYIQDIDTLISMPVDEVKNEMENTNLKQWIKCFYFEDPYIYNRQAVAGSKLPAASHALSAYLSLIHIYDPKDVKAERYTSAGRIIKKQVAKVKKMRSAYEGMTIGFMGIAIIEAIISIVLLWLRNDIIQDQALVRSYHYLMTMAAATIMIMGIPLILGVGKSKSIVYGLLIIGFSGYYLKDGFPVSIHMAFISLIMAFIITIIAFIRLYPFKEKSVLQIYDAVNQEDETINDAFYFTYHSSMQRFVIRERSPLALISKYLHEKLINPLNYNLLWVILWLPGILFSLFKIILY